MRDRQDWVDTWDEHEFEIKEVIEKDDNLVIALHITGRGRSSGATVDVRFFPHVRVRDGKSSTSTTTRPGGRLSRRLA